jgi:hypothetical protein
MMSVGMISFHAAHANARTQATEYYSEDVIRRGLTSFPGADLN